MLGWRRTEGYGRTASANSTPACSSSIWPSWHYYSEDREQVLRLVLGERGAAWRSSDVPPILSSASVWSPIPYPEEIGREETFY
ncbi:hypothetical protein EIQ14_23075 [Xanthomonas campestris pv. campestris]